MEAQRLPCPPASLNDQSVQLSCLQAIPTASNLSLSPLILQPEQALSQTIYLKALTIPLYHPIQSECRQPSNKLPTGRTTISLDSSNMPLIVSPVLHLEETDQLQAVIQKQPGTINIISGLSVLPQNSSPCAPLGSPGKSKSAGKYLCKHCGRDCLKPSVLEKHMRSHTGERPFPCMTCGIAFKTQSNLYKHRRTQTHVNNARQPSETDSSSTLEENEKVTESIGSPQITKANDRNCDLPRTVIKQAISESIDVITDNSYQNVLEKETTKDPSTPLQRRKIQEQKSPTVNKHSQLQRQQATYSEKLWDSRSPDYKLKKCESTDSGYLSRSDSVEQQMLSPSSLHSLSEHSIESESDIATSNLRCTAGNSSKVDLTEKSPGAVTLEKKKLEEHISKLISHNKAVVDDTQLDNVRPRKTVLSKQGSIDLPMPYTYKDSFHFDIRPVDINRKKNLSLCSAKSIFTPVEKSKPLLFHSVPTQFSTTIDCVPVTRSNSLPFVESSRRMQTELDSSQLPSFTRMSPNTSFSGLLRSNNFAASTAVFPNSHPRALVRQVAVDDLPLSNVVESSLSSEEMKGTKKPGARGEGANTKYKKPSQRKFKMFSQEKWQVYGDETFKKIYQKMKNSQTAKKQKGNKVTDFSSFHLDAKETTSQEGIALPRDGRLSTVRNLVSSPVPISAKLNSEESEGCSVGSPMSQCVSSQESSGSFAELMETCSVSDCEHTVMTKTLLERRCKELCVSKQDSSDNSQVQPLNTTCELRFQLQQPALQETGTSLNTASLHDNSLEQTDAQDFIKCVPLLHEDILTNQEEDASGKESLKLAEGGLPSHQCNSSEPVQGPQKLPSERKKLKVDKLKSKENTNLKVSLGLSSLAETIVKPLDCYKLIDMVAPVSVKHPVKGEKQTVMAGKNASGSSMECEEAIQHPIMISDKRDDIANLTDSADVSARSFSEQPRAGIRKGYICNSYALQKLTKKSCPMIAGTEMSCQCGNMSPLPTQHLVCDQVAPHLEKNEFLPKYILKYPQEGNSTGVPLILAGESNEMTCISLPCTSTDSPSPANNNGSLGTNSADVFLCPLQLELSHPTRTKELKWDVRTTLKSLVVCSPAILETTSITARIDRRCCLQSAKQTEKTKDTRKGANNKDNLGDQKPAQEGSGHTIVCTSHTPGKKICFTSMYTGGFFISSDMTGQSSALQLIHSGNSSVISVSSLVERAVLCGSTDKKIKEWQSDVNPFPGFQDLPTCSVDNSRCLCQSSDMLYCHVLCTQQKEICSLSQLSVVSPAGGLKIPNLDISFPTLNAEPQLTWCCLSRNLPLPIEQKEKKDSAYSSLHTCKNENIVSKCSLSFCKMKNTRKAASEGLAAETPKTPASWFSQKQQMGKQYLSTARLDTLLKNIPEQEEAKEKLNKVRGFATNKAKRSRKRKKMKISQKHYKGSYGHRLILLKTSRMGKQHWPTSRALETPKTRPHSHTSDSHDPCGKCLCLSTASQGNDQDLPQETAYTPTDQAASSVKNKQMKEEIPGSIKQHSSGSLSFNVIATVPDVPTASYSCPLATDALVEKASTFDVTSLGILQKEPQPDVNSDHHWSSTGHCNFEFTVSGKSNSRDIVDSKVTSPIFVGSEVDCNSIEVKHQNVLETSVHTTGRKEKSTHGDLYSSLKEQLAPTFETQCPVLLRSKLLPDMSVSNNPLHGSKHVQETNDSSGHLRCTDKNVHSVKPDDNQGKLCKPGFPAFKKPSAFIASSGTVSNSYKKLSVEVINKQAHVEYDDTSSSDDEDRLIIEI
ncbi:zinc finger protein 831 [Rhineura floridana]|uniref:zinc finger protein 831 n=1 Tax=Rhineura floridana TaxID=261503 RepID=UPI002AC7FC1D|nr:zinc finger protein 831 [Rhineura floridana]XP_061487105.1 zinc finger protein 831 [Rhineura floridana]XP_061487106.1 zinc finger protein 831 [Rhineura floridana]XP_061487108.1 zinc finger protein 831 [Rhineura floridana]